MILVNNPWWGISVKAGGGGTNREQPLLLPYDQDGTQEVNWTRAVAGLRGSFGNTSWDWDMPAFA